MSFIYKPGLAWGMATNRNANNYNFASNCTYGSWYAAKDLAKWMAEEYAKDSGIFEKLLISCAKAITNEKVRETLSKKYNLDENFVLRVKNSDDFKSENYCLRFL